MPAIRAARRHPRPTGLRPLLAALTLGAGVLLSPLPALAGAYEDFFRAVNTDNAGGVRELLQKGFDTNARSEQGQTALYLALREGSLKVVEVLLATPGVDVNAANAVGETPLMMAALRGQLPAMEALMAKGARVDGEGWTPLHYAATGPEVKAVSLLLDKGARVDTASPNGSTALMMAARYGSEAAVERLLAAGADPRRKNQREMDAAAFARSAGRDKLADRLAALPAR